MAKAWEIFLTQMAGATRTHKGIGFELSDTERSQLLDSPVLTDLTELGLIKARGRDTVDFLNGQLTGDIREVSERQSRISGICTPKGRLLAVFRIFQRDESYHLSLPTELLESTLKRLRMYVLRAQVELAEAGEDLVRFGYSGPGTEGPLRAALGGLPAKHDQSDLRHGVTVIRLRGPVPRFELCGPQTEMQALWTRLAPGARCTDSTHWRLLDILAGVPNIFAPTVEAFVPQMVNLDLLGGISFTKGCYTGQEIVARTHYLGKLKRRMYRLRVESAGADSPLPGTPVYVPSHGPEAVGTLVDAQAAPSRTTEALAVIQVGHIGHELRLAHPEGERATLHEPPYPLEG